ncbi:MAG TPA: hypothetical protein VGM56_21830 [Byssovorax sp.]|jgi:tetratricopeptide (TPR) repeat protein
MAVGELLRTALLVAVGVAGVAATRGPVVDAHFRAREAGDVYVLPPPAELVPMSLGYRAALADVLWANVLVSQGLHVQQRRHYATVVDYLDAINALDPTFRDPYVMSDTLITFQIGKPSHDEVLKAREILERGAKNLPLDAEVWLDLGAFVAYLAPGTYLDDPAEKAQWRLDGARYLARAAELAGDSTGVSLQAIGGASILNAAGERDAALHFYQRACAVADDPDFKRDCDRHLEALMGEELAERYKAERRAFDDAWRGDVPTANIAQLLLMGPPLDVAYCAGSQHQEAPRCASTWRAWREREGAPRD